MQDKHLTLHRYHFLEASHLPHGYIGGLAGLLMDSVLHPIDTVRTRMKTNIHESVKLLTQFTNMYKHEGAASYFRGFSCTLSGSFVANGGYFFVYEKLKHIFNHRRTFPEEIAPFVAAFIGAICSNTIYLPFIVVRTRMQINIAQYDYRNFFDGAIKILKHEGFRKLYLGGPAFFLQTALDLSLTFGFYEIFYRALKPFLSSRSDVNLVLSAVSSVAAASLAAMIVNPLDVLVARLQTMHTSIHGPCSIPGMVNRIYSYEGFGGFLKGVTGTMSHYSLAALILFPTYETLKEFYKVDLKY